MFAQKSYSIKDNGLVKVFDQCLDVLYQILFFGAVTLSLQKIKLVQSGTKFVPHEFQYFEYRRVTLVFLSTIMQNKVFFCCSIYLNFTYSAGT